MDYPTGLRSRPLVKGTWPLGTRLIPTNMAAMAYRCILNPKGLYILPPLFFLLALLWLPNWRFFGLSHKSEKCLVFSPAFPSEGGAGCSPRCVPRKGEATRTYVAIFYEELHSWPSELAENMRLAASILKRFGQPRSLDTEGAGRYLHVSFDYYCCYTTEEGMKIGQFLNNYSWTPHEIWFDKIECAIHGYNDAVSIVLMVDKKSQQELSQWVLQNERDLEETAGVKKHIPHTQLQDFHMTLGTVNQSSFPVQSAVEEINRVISPGKWHATPVVVNRPVCGKCEREIKARKT